LNYFSGQFIRLANEAFIFALQLSKARERPLLPAFHALLRAGSPEDAVAAFPYLSDLEKNFVLRGLFENWTKELAGGWDGLPPHLMAWVARKRGNGHAGDDTPGTFDA
jgi:hypothetical protein